MKVEILFSTIALLVSLGSLIISFLGYRLRRSDYQSGKPNIKVRYEDGYAFQSGKIAGNTEKHCWSFKVSITNVSNRKTAITDTILRVKHSERGGSSAIIALKPVNMKNEDISLPASIDPLGCIAGWITFSLAKVIYNDLKNIKYELEIIDTAEIGSTVHPVAVSVREPK